MWLVKLALRRPYALAVVAILLAVLGGITIQRTPADVLPEIDIPVVSAIWQYRGLSAQEMARRITMPSERSFTTTVSDIEHIESQSLSGISVIKVFFHPGTSVDAAVAQTTAISQTVTRQMPPGTNPPLIVRFNASSVPILQLGLGGEGLAEQTLYDLGSNFLRTQLATVQGASVLQPAGGRARQILVDLDADAMYARGVSPADVSAAINAQSPILPSGSIKMGAREYAVQLNTSPTLVAALNDLPVVQRGSQVIYVKDVAQVRDGGAVQTNIVRQDGRRGALVGILKTGHTSTLRIVDRVKETLPRILATLPPELEVKLLLDQSRFVRAAVRTVLNEAVLAAILSARARGRRVRAEKGLGDDVVRGDFLVVDGFPGPRVSGRREPAAPSLDRGGLGGRCAARFLAHDRTPQGALGQEAHRVRAPRHRRKMLWDLTRS